MTADSGSTTRSAASLPVARSLDREGMPAVTVRDLLTMGGGLGNEQHVGNHLESLPLDQFDRLVQPAASPIAGRHGRCLSTPTPAMPCWGESSRRRPGCRSRSSCSERLCAPLGMTSTGFDARDVDPDRLATGYRVTGDGTHVPEPQMAPGAYSAMGGLLSTVEDLARWVAGMTGAWRDDAPAHPVDRWSLREMQELARFVATDTTGGAVTGRLPGIGFGLQVNASPGARPDRRPLGRLPGFGSHMRWHPASGWAVVALGNSRLRADAPAGCGGPRPARHRDRVGARIAGRRRPSSPWPETVGAMEIAERLLDGDDRRVTDDVWSPNMDLDLPRPERVAALGAVREAIGPFARDVASVRHPSPARASWTVTGESGTARLEVWMTPERTPRIQKLTVTAPLTLRLALLVDGLDALTRQLRQVIEHALEHLGGMAHPADELAEHPQRLVRAVRPRHVAGKRLSVRFGSSSNAPGGLDEVDAAGRLAEPARLPRPRHPGSPSCRRTSPPCPRRSWSCCPARAIAGAPVGLRAMEEGPGVRGPEPRRIDLHPCAFERSQPRFRHGILTPPTSCSPHRRPPILALSLPYPPLLPHAPPPPPPLPLPGELGDARGGHVAQQLRVGLPVDWHLDGLLVDLVVGQPRAELRPGRPRPTARSGCGSSARRRRRRTGRRA